MAIDTQYFKEKLETERDELVKQLKQVGRKNPENPDDWESTPEQMDTLESEREERASRVTAYQQNTAILHELEARYNNVKDALERIEGGSYGTCAIGNEEIEQERLEANPAARTCSKHLDREEELQHQ